MLLIVGANPLVSHGSVMSAPRIKDQLHAITDRGGRVVVVDPRRSETAREFEHVALHPDSDAWLLLSLLHVIFAEGLQDAGAIALRAEGGDGLRGPGRAARRPEATEARPASPAERRPRSWPATSPRAERRRDLRPHRLVPGPQRDPRLVPARRARRSSPATSTARAGRCSATRAIHFDRVAELIGADSYGKRRSRVGDFPEVLGAMPASLMAKEITTPGPGQMRALFVSAGNPVLSVPDGEELAAAIGAARPLRRDRHLHVRHRQARRLRAAGDHLPRARGLPAAVPGPVHEALHQHDRGGRRAGRRGAPGVGDRRGDRRAGSASSPRACSALRLLGRAGIKLSPRRLVETAAPASARRATASACAAAGSTSKAAARGPARDRPRRAPRGRRAGAEDPPRGRAGPALPARDRRRGRARWSRADGNGGGASRCG